MSKRPFQVNTGDIDISNEPLHVVCVLKSGGDYTAQYVKNLFRGVWTFLEDTPFKFVCLTDMKFEPIRGVHVVPLQLSLKGWWSKLEVFRVLAPAIYLDLDTVVTGSLKELADAVLADSEHSKVETFYMLRAFNKKEKWASGVMAWCGDFRWLINSLKTKEIAHFHFEQRYIKTRLISQGVGIRAVQDYIKAVSYKHDIVTQAVTHNSAGVPLIPEDTRLVCFHGRPRPHEVGSIWFPTGEHRVSLRPTPKEAEVSVK